MKIPSALGVIFAGLVCGVVALAQEDPNKGQKQEDWNDFAEVSLEEMLNTPIEVSSTKVETIFNTPSTVSVIDRAAIEQYGFVSVTEALNTLAGVQVYRTSLMRHVPTIRGILQEHFTNKVLLLIDGVPAWMAVTGDGNIDRISIEDLERIEVLRGPASVLYGTNAFSGAINLVLRKQHHEPSGSSRQGQARARIDQLGQIQSGGSFRYADPLWSFAITANGGLNPGRSSSFLDERGIKGIIHDYQQGVNLTLLAKLHTRFGDHSLLFNADRIEESFLGIVPEYLSGAGNSQTMNGYLVNYGYELAIEKIWDLHLGASFDWNQRDFSRKDDDLVRGISQGYRLQPFFHSSLSIRDFLRFELGGDLDLRKAERYDTYNPQSHRVLNANVLNGKSLSEFSLFAQGEVIGQYLPVYIPFRLLLGTRYTQNELFKANVSLRGALLYSIAESMSLKLAAGESYRAPTLFELYYESPMSEPSVSGSADLKPELCRSLELSYLLTVGSFFGQVTGFYSSYEQKIFRVREVGNPDPSAQIYVNGGQLTAWGVEVELKYQNPKIINAFLSYTWLNGDKGDAAPEDPQHYNFRYVPKNVVSLGLARRIADLQVSTVLNYIDSRLGPLEPVHPQITWDLNLAYQTSWGRHALSAKNLLDERILTPDYVRRNLSAPSTLNAAPADLGRLIIYSFSIDF